MDLKILYHCIQEAFHVTRLAFAGYKMKIRATLAATHMGPETLEEAVQDYIDRHRSELYETADLVDVRTPCTRLNSYTTTELLHRIRSKEINK